MKVAPQPVFPPTDSAGQCSHCGTSVDGNGIADGEWAFCCSGCQTVYHLLQDNGLGQYYRIENQPGSRPSDEGRYASLDDPKVASAFLDYSDAERSRVRFVLPAMHCVACIWLLEHLYKLHPGVQQTEVDFPRQEISLQFDHSVISLREVAELLDRLGYPPRLSYADASTAKKSKLNRRSWYDLGIAGFCFGNTMLMAFPEYLGINEPMLARVFQWLSLALSLPVMYSARSYLRSAWHGLRQRNINMDVPISLGILVLFGRSVLDVSLGWGPGYFDSLAGLVFFLLIGRAYQSKTYHRLSFERDYRSYFPLSATRMDGLSETEIPIGDLKANDRILVRHGELIPADGRLVSGKAELDYSFVTGEADPVPVELGAVVYAGARQQGGTLEVLLEKEVEQGYLSRLWAQDSFSKEKDASVTRWSGRIAQWFTPVVILIALGSGTYWWLHDPGQVWEVVSAVLIVACPCALALSTPFTLGHVLRLLGQRGLFLKGPAVVESLAGTEVVVFDKTGTLTKTETVTFEGVPLTDAEALALRSLLRASLHPLSRRVYRSLPEGLVPELESFEELKGLGIQGWVNGHWFRLGSAKWLGLEAQPFQGGFATTHLSIDGVHRGCFLIGQHLRPAMSGLLSDLSESGLELGLLSGDPGADQSAIESVLPVGTWRFFGQSPQEKLERIRSLQANGSLVAMVGDGLNDAGALQQSDVGIAVTDELAAFTPASDAILRGEALGKLPAFRALAKRGLNLIWFSFGISMLYNLIGLSFAVTGNLSPLVAAILMPLSSVSVVVFATLGVHLAARNTFKPESS